MSTGLRIAAAGVELSADVGVPDGVVHGVVLFAHGSGSSRTSPRNRFVAGELNAAGLATVLADLLTPGEERIDATTREHRFDIGLLATRLAALTDWTSSHEPFGGAPVGLFGASTGAAAALVAAAERPSVVRAVVSRGGRPDLAGDYLDRVRAPTLLIVGEADPVVLRLNRAALGRLRSAARLATIPGATHLFQEPGTLEQVARLATDWFVQHLPRPAPKA